MKRLKGLSNILCVLATACSMFQPVHAQENIAESEPMVALSTLNVQVVGKGTVTVADDENVYSLNDDETILLEFPVKTSVTFELSTDGILESVTKNGESIKSFENGMQHMSFKYLTDETDVDFVFTFKEKKVERDQAQEDKTLKKEEETELVEDSTNDKALIQDSVDRTKLRNDGVLIDFSITENTRETIQVLADHSQGNIDGYKTLRKEKATEEGLLKYCDENYFMSEEYFSKYDVNMLMFDNCAILNPYLVSSVQKEQQLMFTDSANQSVMLRAPSSRASGLTVIDIGYFTMTNPIAGGTLNNGLWRLSSQQLAFCAQGNNASPMIGDATEPPQVADNANLRKALYYGYGGPGDILTSRYGVDSAIVITDDLVSNAYCGTSIGKTFSNGYHWGFISSIWNEIVAKPDPKGYTAYIVPVPGQGTNWQGQWVNKQALTYGIYTPTGELQINKVSANPSISSNNSCYSLTGAQYGVYRNSNATGQVGTLTIQDDGWSNTLSGLDQGTYYLKETKAPAGYAKDETIYTVTVNGGKKTTKEVKDYPQADPIGILLRKQDAEHATNPILPLNDAYFTVKYYAEYYDVDPATQGKTPVRTWVFKTDSDGFTYLSNEYKVSGDALYYSSNGDASLPLGTVTIQETKAPNGYYVNNEVFVRKITSQGSLESVNTYNEPIVKDNRIKFRINKIQETTATPISGAQFLHTKPNGQTEELTTNENGIVEIKGMQTGRHKIQETYAPDGYEINSTIVEFDVGTNGTISFVTNLNGTGISQVKEQDGNTLMTVADKVSPFDFKIKKKNDHNAPLDGAEFTIYSDKDCTKVVSTLVTENGELTFEDLKDRTHYWIKETKAPQGYRIPVDESGNVHVYELYTESTPEKGIFNFWIDGVQYSQNNVNPNDQVHLEGTKDNRVVTMTVVNYVGLQLPTTGSKGTAVMMVLGTSVMAVMMYLLFKRKTKGE